MLSESPGVIDLRHPQQHYARTALWVAQRFPLLSRLRDRYDTGDGISAESQALIMKRSLRERIDDFSTAGRSFAATGQPFPPATQLPSTISRSSTLAANLPAPHETHAARLISPSAESSAPPATLRISRRPAPPALKSGATITPNVSPGETAQGSASGEAAGEASTADSADSPVIDDLKSVMTAPPIERVIVSKSTAAVVQPNDLPATREDSRAVENESSTQQAATTDQKQNRRRNDGESRETNPVEIRAAAVQRGQSPPSMIFTKRVSKRSGDESNTDAADGVTAEQVSSEDAGPSGVAGISSGYLSIPGSPAAQAPASIVETEPGMSLNSASNAKTGPGANPHSTTTVQAARVSREAPPQVVDNSGPDRVTASQAQGELVLRKASNVEATQLREDALSSVMRDTTQPIISDSATGEQARNAAPLRIQRSPQGDRQDKGRAVGQGSSQPVLAVEIGEDQAPMSEPAIIWRKSASGAPGDEPGAGWTNSAAPRISRQPDDSASVGGPSQSSQIVVPQAPTEQAQDGEIDVGQITRQVIRSISRRLAVERERRGITK